MDFARLVLITTIVIANCNMVEAKSFREASGKGKYGLSLSYEDYDFSNKMKSTTGIHTPSYINRHFQIPVERSTVILRGAYGLDKRNDIFAGIGYSDEKLFGKGKPNIPSGNNYTQSGEDAIYELGFKGTIFDFFENKFYTAYLAKFCYTESGNNFTGPYTPSSAKTRWQEFVFELECGYRIKEFNLTPYGGVSYFDISGKQYLDDYVGVDNYDSKYNNTDKFGYFLGLAYEITDNLSINAEGMFEAREGFKLGLEFKF